MSMAGLGAIGLAALLLALLGYAIAAGGRRVLRHDGALRLAEVLRARKLPLPRPTSEAEVVAAAGAVRRCVACAEQRRCDLAIAERDWKLHAELCPNRAFIEGQRAKAA